MSRVTKYKLYYFALLFVIVFLAYIVVVRWRISAPVIIGLAVALLVPGRLQGYLFRDLFRGRRELDNGNAQSALKHFQQFLTTIHNQPWRTHALWLSYSIYTPSVEAMSMNNIGSAHFKLGATDDARRAWLRAIDIDHEYPLPHANLSLLAATLGDKTGATKHLDLARALGYSGTAFDRIVNRVQSALASVEGR